MNREPLTLNALVLRVDFSRKRPYNEARIRSVLGSGFLFWPPVRVSARGAAIVRSSSSRRRWGNGRQGRDKRIRPNRSKCLSGGARGQRAGLCRGERHYRRQDARAFAEIRFGPRGSERTGTGQG